MSGRSQVIRRETAAILALYLLFFAWWYLTAYGLGDMNPLEYSLDYKWIFGFPKWFFYSCIVGYLGISTLLWIVVKFFFEDISFEEECADE